MRKSKKTSPFAEIRIVDAQYITVSRKLTLEEINDPQKLADTIEELLWRNNTAKKELAKKPS